MINQVIVEIIPITKSSNYGNHIEVTANPTLKNNPSYLVPEYKRQIERLKAEANLTGQTVESRNKIFKQIKELEDKC